MGMQRKQRMSVGEYMTIQAAAQALGLSYWQCYRIVHKERVPLIRVGNTILVRLSDVEVAR